MSSVQSGGRGCLSAGYHYMLALFLAPKWKRYHPTDGCGLATLPPANTGSVSGSRIVVWNTSLSLRSTNCKNCRVASSVCELDERPLVAIVSCKSHPQSTKADQLKVDTHVASNQSCDIVSFPFGLDYRSFLSLSHSSWDSFLTAFNATSYAVGFLRMPALIAAAFADMRPALTSSNSSGATLERRSHV